LGQQEVVIKPLTGLMKAIKYASGATILSTGKAAIIVDVVSLL
jgi:chemotaxis protein histidine kinase CheA